MGLHKNALSKVRKVPDHVIFIPPSNELLLPILEIVPLQLLVSHIAVRLYVFEHRARAHTRRVVLHLIGE